MKNGMECGRGSIPKMPIDEQTVGGCGVRERTATYAMLRHEPLSPCQHEVSTCDVSGDVFGTQERAHTHTHVYGLEQAAVSKAATGVRTFAPGYGFMLRVQGLENSSRSVSRCEHCRKDRRPGLCLEQSYSFTQIAVVEVRGAQNTYWITFNI